MGDLRTIDLTSQKRGVLSTVAVAPQIPANAKAGDGRAISRSVREQRTVDVTQLFGGVPKEPVLTGTTIGNRTVAEWHRTAGEVAGLRRRVPSVASLADASRGVSVDGCTAVHRRTIYITAEVCYVPPPTERAETGAVGSDAHCAVVKGAVDIAAEIRSLPVIVGEAGTRSVGKAL